MGRIKTKKIKSAGDEIFKKYGDKFSKKFEENKEILQEVAEIKSKKLRNIIAGYLTRKAKEEKI